MKYTYTEHLDPLTNEVVSILRSDGWSIPIDPTNSDYQAYLNPVEHLTEIVASE